MGLSYALAKRGSRSTLERYKPLHDNSMTSRTILIDCLDFIPPGISKVWKTTAQHQRTVITLLGDGLIYKIITSCDGRMHVYPGPAQVYLTELHSDLNGPWRIAYAYIYKELLYKELKWKPELRKCTSRVVGFELTMVICSTAPKLEKYSNLQIIISSWTTYIKSKKFHCFSYFLYISLLYSIHKFNRHYF